MMARRVPISLYLGLILLGAGGITLLFLLFLS